MKRRQLIRYIGAGTLAALGSLGISGRKTYQAQTSTGALTIQWLGHTCFLFTGSGLRILVNPFQPLGCTAGYRAPNVVADLVLISSRLLDEGAVTGLPGNPRVLYEPGVYDVNGIRIQGVTLAHDREGGRRFGLNVAWQWSQGGVKVLHLGGAAAPIEVEQKILLGSPDLALIPVGGGPKAYNPQEARQAVQSLNPKVVIPTQYRTQAASPDACDLVSVEEFLQLADGMQVRRTEGNQLVIGPASLPEQGTVIQVLSSQSMLKT